MKTKPLLTIFVIAAFISTHAQTVKEYTFNYINNAENCSGESDQTTGLVLKFDVYNRDKEIGIGGGWLIHKKGTKYADSLAQKLYPKHKFYAYSFVLDLFMIEDQRYNSQVDSLMLKDFDAYLYLTKPSYIDLRLNSDGQTYSIYKKYPHTIAVYKKKAGDHFFAQINTYVVKDEANYNTTLDLISEFMEKTASYSNIK